MLNVVTVQAGNYLGRGADYVNILYDSVRRNLPVGYPGRFVCFTDDPTGLADGIETRPLPDPHLKGWWNKLSLFRPGLFDDGDRVLFFDLDTLITGRLDELVECASEFAILSDFMRPNGLQSSVMSWRAGGQATKIWGAYEEQGFPEIDGGDQAFIEHTAWSYEILQRLYPSLFVSYKVSGGKIPSKASVVVFHGKPRPHEVTTGWVPEVWKIGGITRADLDTICNTTADEILANVRANIKRSVLAWYDTAPTHNGQVAIVGGGPSVKSKLDEIIWRKSLGQQIWALNGAGHWLMQNGVEPDAIVVLDARQENIGFVKPSYGAEYLVASQVHPKLLDALYGRRVTLWHANVAGVQELVEDVKNRPVHLIGGGSTVGLNAMVLAFARGFRAIHLYGFDSSISEEGAHAYAQPLNDGDLIVDAIAGDRKFRAAPWMVQQAEEFVPLALSLTDDGAIITVAGDGLLPHIAQNLSRERPASAVDLRAMSILRRLPEDGKLLVVEIGVFTGALSAELLRGRSNLTLVMVDSWEGQGAAYSVDSGDWHAELSQAAQDRYMQEALDRTQFATDRRVVLRKRSVVAAGTAQPASIDLVFIDGDHSYEGCRADIEAWVSRVKPGGWLSGHDYDNPDFPDFGVKRAVDEFAKDRGLNVELDANLTWFIRLPT